MKLKIGCMKFLLDLLFRAVRREDYPYFTANARWFHCRNGFEHPQIGSSQRVGKWEVGDGEREIRFNDGREPSEYFLIKRGLRFAFQTKKGLSNDDGSPVLLMRNEGLSRKASYPLRLWFFEEGIAKVGGRDSDSDIGGKWTWSGSSIVVSASMTQPDQPTGGAKGQRDIQVFLEWDKSSNDLILEKNGNSETLLWQRWNQATELDEFT